MQTCPKMKATDTWLYLCACHKKPMNCSAIDYMIHSLDHATSTMQDPRNFENKLEIQKKATKHLESIVRRLYRLFSHTYFHHEEVFLEHEKKTFLCTRFVEFAKKFNMMSDDLFIIPESAIQGLNSSNTIDSIDQDKNKNTD